MKNYFLGIGFILSLFVVIIACNKDNASTISSTKTPLVVYLTDGPVSIDTVNLDIKTIEVKLDTNAAHKLDDHFGDHDVDSLNDRKSHDGYGVWDTLTFTPGVINVAALRNGIDQMVATGVVTGTIRKIRLSLGTNNTVVFNGVTYPLVIKSKFVYVDIKKKHHQNDSLNSAATALKIDIDLYRSIKLINGVYYFLPYLKPFNDENFARLSGLVTPADARPFITVFNSTDTSYGVASKNGYYKFRGLQAGNYSVSFKGNNGYKDTTISNIVLNIGTETKVPTITLHK